MDVFEALASALSWSTVGWVCLGTLYGLIFGIIPGLTAMLAVIILIPVTYSMAPVTGISMLVGVYIGSISGGLVAAILLGMPGTPSSITTALDGFALTRQGQAGRALGIGITSNLVGCLIGWFFLVLGAPLIANFAVNFGPVEYVSVVIFGLTVVISLSGDSLPKGALMAAFGLMLSTIGIDPINGMARNTLGLSFLEGGISFVPALIGLFVVAQVFNELKNMNAAHIIPQTSVSRVVMTWREMRESAGNFLRSALIGVFIGILPGVGASLSTFVSYDQAKKASKNPETFGKGNIQGIVASETTNNAGIGGALIPLLSLGIPGDAITAALLGGLQIHGIEPGPLLASEHPELISGVFIYFLIATVCMYLTMILIGARVFPIVLRVRKSFLMPLVLVFSLIGCYNISYSITDVWVSFLFGIMGFFLSRHGYPLVPLVITIVLGSMFEKQLRTALLLTKGSLLPFVTTPVSMLFLILSAFSVYYALRQRSGQRGVHTP
ncbi:MAG: tripartite tricarboxylate transporter permease [Desulfovibrio sp.]|jgi:putative tricarboxylic transport membrane protein|nr:tripartite tricarboxylate transporter permease [Desulfovibrio sp.]